jgi:hypothetical protein
LKAKPHQLVAAHPATTALHEVAHLLLLLGLRLS